MKAPDRAYVDANVILRFLTGDPPEMAAQARALFAAVEQGAVALVLDEIILAETVWVLSSFYHHAAADIARTLQQLLDHPGLEASGKTGLLQALNVFGSQNVDFADALVSVHMQQQGIPDIYSFDRHFDRLPGIRRVAPAADPG
jgi:predicted nucleic acid-binding protein